MINTALSSLGPNSRFLGRSTMEHVHGILLEHVYGILPDEKFLYRSVHTAFMNTKWYGAWLERTQLLDPIIFDMWIPGVPCNSHHSRHTGQDTVVVPYLRFWFFPPSQVGPAFITHVGCLSRHLFVCSQSIDIACVSCRVSPLLVFPSEYRHCLCFFCWFSQSTTILCVSLRVSPLLVFLLLVFSEYRHCFSFFLVSTVGS